VTKFFGKYRGRVIDNVDPLDLLRILVEVPQVLGPALSLWALPCVPAAGMLAGSFAVPAIGSQVWVEFEGGDPDYPIWTGGFWGEGDAPVISSGQVVVLQSQGQNAVTISDGPGTPASGGIVLKSASGAVIVVNETGIYIANGQGASVSLVGPNVQIESAVE
jgi:hypothetical protein